MLEVFIERIPDYYEHKLKKSLKKPLQTLVHGDFHGGNHMYGTDENEGKVIALDYQMFGKGFVARFLQEPRDASRDHWIRPSMYYRLISE